MWNAGWLWSQCRGNGLHLELIWGTPSYFAFLGGHQYSSRLVAVLLGTLWFSINQIEAPYVFDWEHGVALHPMQWNRAMGKSHGFSRVAAGTWGIFPSLGGDDNSKLVFVQQRQDSCLVTMDTSGIETRLMRTIRRFWR